MNPEHSKRSRRTQRQEVLGELMRAHGGAVAAWVLAKHSLQYNARIHELRQLGFRIISEVNVVNGIRHGYFRLLTGPAAITASISPTAEQSQSDKLFPDTETLNHDYDLEHLPD